jgi:molybdopterin converting factor subunit 1
MRVRVLLFAALREAVGEKSLELELRDSATVADLLAQLEAKHRVFAGHRGKLLVARNEERALPTAVLHDGDEIALLPPISGGSESVGRVPTRSHRKRG